MTDELLHTTHARIQQAAFEAAYMDMPHPDPASHGFATLVFSHVERLWAEHRARQREAHAAAFYGDPHHASSEPYGGDLFVTWSSAEPRWEQSW